jgi:hypothetical protein
LAVIPDPDPVVILNLFQDLFQHRSQDRIGLIDSGPAAGMTKRGGLPDLKPKIVILNLFQDLPYCHPELVSGSDVLGISISITAD